MAGAALGGPARGRADRGARAAHHRDPHPNLRAAYADLRSRGIEFIRPPRDPDPALGIESVVCCRDPDGNLIELIEYMPGVLGSRIDHLPKR